MEKRRTGGWLCWWKGPGVQSGSATGPEGRPLSRFQLPLSGWTGVYITDRERVRASESGLPAARQKEMDRCRAGGKDPFPQQQCNY